MENNKQNNNQKSSVRKKANILMLSGTLLFLIVGITIGGLMFRNSNLNKTNIQTLEKQLLSLKKLKGPKGEDGLTGPQGLKGNPGRNGNEITNLELLAKIKTLDFNDETLKSKLMNVVKNELNKKAATEALNKVNTELSNKDLTEAFNKLFKATPEYTTALKAYKVSQFENTDKYTDALNAYKASEFIKTDKYTDALNAYKVNKNEFIKTKTYNALLEQYEQEEIKVNKFKATPEYTTALNAYKATEFKATPEYKTALENWRNSEVEKKTRELESLYRLNKNKKNRLLPDVSLDQFKQSQTDKLPTDKNQLNLIFNEELFESKTEYQAAFNAYKTTKKAILETKFKNTKEYKDALKAYKVIKFKETPEYTGVLKAYKVIKFKETPEYTGELNVYKVNKSEFIKTNKYKTPFNAFVVNENEFIKTDAYKNAFASYLFSFEGKLNTLTGAVNKQKKDLEGKLATQKSALEAKITKDALKTLLNNVFASKVLSELDQTKLNGLKDKLVKVLSGKFATLATKTALSNQKSNLETQINTKLTTSELLEKIKGLNFDEDLKAKIVSAVQSELNDKADITALKDQKTNLEGKISGKLTTSELLKKIKGLNFDDATLKAKIKAVVQSELDQKATTEALKDQKTNLETQINTKLTTVLKEYLKESEFIDKLYNVLSKTTKTSANSDEVIAVILKMVEDKIIKNAFDKLVKEFKTKTDISQQTGRELHNTEKTNSFYKLAPFLFETPAQANAKLNALLEGDTDNNKDKLAIWNTDSNNWIIGTLNDLKAEKTDGKVKYKTLQKVVYQTNTWNTKGTDNLYEAPTQESDS